MSTKEKKIKRWLTIFIIFSLASPVLIAWVRSGSFDATVEGANGTITIQHVHYCYTPFVNGTYGPNPVYTYGPVQFIHNVEIIEIYRNPLWASGLIRPSVYYPRTAPERVEVVEDGVLHTYDTTKRVYINSPENVTNRDLDIFRHPLDVGTNIWLICCPSEYASLRTVYKDGAEIITCFKDGERYNVRWEDSQSERIKDIKKVGIFSLFGEDRKWIKTQYLWLIAIMTLSPRHTDDLAIFVETPTFWLFFFVLSHFLKNLFKTWKTSFFYALPTTVSIYLLTNAVLSSLQSHLIYSTTFLIWGLGISLVILLMRKHDR